MPRLEEVALKLKELGLPLWLIVLIMVLPLTLRGVGSFARSIVTGRADARAADAVTEEWRDLINEIRRGLDSCIAKHEECLEDNRKLGDRVAELERRCGSCASFQAAGE